MITTTNDKIQARYDELFKDEKNLFAISDRLNEMSDDPVVDDLRAIYCDDILFEITAGYIEYGDRKYFMDDPLILLFIDEERKLKHEESILKMMSAFFRNDEKQVYEHFDKYADRLRTETDNDYMDERAFIELFAEPLKNAYPGFWLYAQKKTAGIWKNDGTDEMCQLMADVYERTSDDDAIDKLTAFVRIHPNIVAAREYLGIVYSNAKMWNNAIATLESVDDPNVFTTNMAEYYSVLAWCYGKIKDYKNEEFCYRKVLEEKWNYLFALNNLGYCLYKQKRFVEANEIFKQCIEENRDLPLSANNYVKTLIALGRNKDAKEFIKQGKYNISRNLKEKVQRLPATNKRLSSKAVESNVVEDADDNNIAQKTVLSVKGQQFSNEKLLEDELTNRIESGIPVFGKQLKVYKRKGEYGRQYIIPIGRLDLLCEDDNGELYIIELKKDGGYGDAYEQTVRYLDWFQNSSKFKNTKINGIICLNSPAPELVKRIHEDERMRVFEYQISYTEL